ncbi:MAG: hypothetical protein J7L15_00670, partial [Clostridiales bacterium]|nr:hypothetical protein [Clostridiales bacterium]
SLETGDGSVSFPGGTSNVTVSGNSSEDTYISWNSINSSKYDSSNGLDRLVDDDFSQINYQVSFDFSGSFAQNNTLNTSNKNYEQREIDSLFNLWKSNYILVNTSKDLIRARIYSKETNENRYLLGKEESIYDRVIPFVGSYKDIDVASFQLIVSGEESNLNHFVVCLVPEKVRFKASNVETLADYIERTGDPAGYVLEEIEEIYTGNAKLAIIYNEFNSIRNDKNTNIVIRNISDSFNIYEFSNFKILVNLARLYYEGVANSLNIAEDLVFGYDRFSCSVSVFRDDMEKFSDTFLVDLTAGSNLSDDPICFDIGFGVPSNGYYIADAFLPYNTSVFEQVNVVYDFTNITLGSPTFEVNSSIITSSSVMPNRSELVGDYSYYDYTSYGVYIPNVNPLVTDPSVIDPSADTDPSSDIGPGIPPRDNPSVVSMPGYRNFFEVFDLLSLGTARYQLTQLGSVDDFNSHEGDSIFQSAVYSTMNSTDLLIKFKTFLIPDRIVILNNETREELWSIIPVSTYENYFEYKLNVINDLAGSNTIEVQVHGTDIYTDWYIVIEFYWNVAISVFQVPVSMEGLNKSPSLSLGRLNDVHLAWSSNRDNYWNIFYANLFDKELAFREEVKISDSESNSLSSSISTNINGDRMIVWHDNRGGDYDIFAARSLRNEYNNEKICYNNATIMFDLDIDDVVEMDEYLEYNHQEGELSFIYTNESGGTEVVAFGATFYIDDMKRKYKYQALSATDNRRWFVKTNVLTVVPTAGVSINAGETIEVIYVPDISPQLLSRTQDVYDIDGAGTVEYFLLCGVDYYIDIDSYIGGISTELDNIVFKYNCSSVGYNFWGENKDSENWLCSGQGTIDLKVTEGFEQYLYPSVSGNIFNQFLISFHSLFQPENKKDIPMSRSILWDFWDSEHDKIYSSGQGLYEKGGMNGHRPLVSTDQMNNFYISANGRSDIYTYNCNMPLLIPVVPEDNTSVVIPEGDFYDYCFPNYFDDFTTAVRETQIRVYEEDMVDSLVINKDKVVSVIDKKNVRFDVLGYQGAYAVRIKRAMDDSWGDWVTIDLLSANNETLTDIEVSQSIKAFSIDSDRFIVPYELIRLNGMTRICFQILTFFGKTEESCIDIFVNMPIVIYAVEYYWDSSRVDQISNYNGIPLLSEKLDVNGVPEGESTTIYIKVVFNEEQDEGDQIIFNVIQQGLHDQYSKPLVRQSGGLVYYGDFKIYDEDGIFDADGLGFVNVILPDAFNPNLTTSTSLTIFEKDLDSKAVFDEYINGQIYKAFDYNSFRQYYDRDDNNLLFGNLRYFRE